MTETQKQALQHLANILNRCTQENVPAEEVMKVLKEWKSKEGKK